MWWLISPALTSGARPSRWCCLIADLQSLFLHLLTEKNLTTWRPETNKLSSTNQQAPVHVSHLLCESRAFRKAWFGMRWEDRDHQVLFKKGWKWLCFVQSVSSWGFYLSMMHDSVKIEYPQSLRWFTHCCSIADDFSTCHSDDGFLSWDSFHHYACSSVVMGTKRWKVWKWTSRASSRELGFI